MVVHPALGRVPVIVEDGCPRVDRGVALDLIRRIELWEENMCGHSHAQGERVALIREYMTGYGAQGVAQGLCRALKEGNADEVPAWIEALIRIMFPETPDRITREVSQYAAPTAEALCWNRRKRRSLERSKGVILHLCCGSCRGEFQASASRHGMIVLDVDCKEDLNNPHTASYLLRLAGLGKLRGVMSGLPCRTRSVLRNRAPGPPVIRGRFGESCWGLQGVDLSDQDKLFEDDCLLMRTLLLKVVAATGLKLACPDSPPLLSLLENPRDPVSFLGSEAEHLPSLWITPEWLTVQEFLGLQQYHLNQGPLGHTKVKPTTVAAHGLYWPVWARDITDKTCYPSCAVGSDDSKTWAAWAPGLKAAVREAIDNLGDVWHRYKVDPEALKALAPRKVRTSFADHVANGHVPFRADCRHCLEGRLRARPHRRQPAADSFVLSLDLMGPHKSGRDEILDEVRYVLVAVYTFPETLGVGGSAAPDEPARGPPLDVDEQEWEIPENLDPVEPDIVEPQPDLSEELELPTVPMVELVWVEPLARKTESETLRAVKRVTAAITLLGLPVIRVHTDGGREFCNKGFRAFCDDKGFVKSCTGGDDFKSNGRVENMIGVLKGRARTLLRAGGNEWQDWPFAIRHCAAQHRTFNFNRLGWKTDGLRPFNAVVHAQERSWRMGEWGQRAAPARILAPAKEVERAYVVRTEDGHLRNVKVLFGGVVDRAPGVDELPEVPLVVDAPSPPEVRRRLRGKSPGLRMHESDSTAVPIAKASAQQMRLLQAHAEDEMAAFLAHTSAFDPQKASQTLQQSCLATLAVSGRTVRSAMGKSVVFGAYSRGGIRGIAAATFQFPGLTALALRLVKHAAPQAPFTSLALLIQTCAPPHKDKYNLPQNNIIVPLDLPPSGAGGGIWVEDPNGADIREVRTGLQVRGRVEPLQRLQAFHLDPHQWHSTEPWSSGRRVLLVAFSVKGSLLLTPQERADLLTVGFPLPFLSETPETREGGDHPVSFEFFEDDPSASEAQGGSVKPNSKLGLHRSVSFAERVEWIHVPWINESQDMVYKGSPAPAGVGVGDGNEVGVEGFQDVAPAPAGGIKTCLNRVSGSECEGQILGLAEPLGQQMVIRDDAICCDVEKLDCVTTGATEFDVQGDEDFPGENEFGSEVVGSLLHDDGFGVLESRALGLRTWIDQEYRLIKHEPPESEERQIVEGFLCKAVSALCNLQDQAAAQVPDEVEYSLLPDCEVLSSHTVPLQEVYKQIRGKI